MVSLYDDAVAIDNSH